MQEKKSDSKLQLALDMEFDDARDKADALINDLNQGYIPIHRLCELLSANIFEREEYTNGDTGERFVTVYSRTFFAYAFPRIQPQVLTSMLDILEQQLGRESLQLHFKILNHLDEKTAVSLYDLYHKDYGDLNSEERSKINATTKALIASYFPALEHVVQVDQVNTHNQSSNKTANESHVQAFQMMIKGKGIALRATFTPGNVRIANGEVLHQPVSSSLLQLQGEIHYLLALDNAGLYETFLRFDDIAKYQSIGYNNLTPLEKEHFDKKGADFKFKAAAAKRYIDEMISAHTCSGEDYPYRTNEPMSCGLTIEEMIASAHWACTDKGHFRNADNVTINNNFLLLINQLYDMKRGYNIDEGIDNPDIGRFPQEAGVDKNRCSGGATNSLVWALQSVHTAYNPKKIERQDVEKEVFKIYQEIINTKLSITTSKDAIDWVITQKIPSTVKDEIILKFNSSYLAQLKEDFYGYIPDSIFHTIVDNTLDLVPIPQSVLTLAHANMSAKDVQLAICNKILPLVYLDNATGHMSILNHFSTLPGKDGIINEIITMTMQQGASTIGPVLMFLSLNQLDKRYTEQVLLQIENQPLTLNDLAGISAYLIQHIAGNTLDHNTLNMGIYNQIQLFRLHVQKRLHADLPIDSNAIHFAVLTNDSEIIKAVFAKAEDQLVELLTQPGLTDEPVLHLAIEHGYATAINAILQVVPVSELFALADSEGKTALHSAVDSQNVEIVKMVCQAAGDRLPDLFKITDNSNYEALRYAIENGEVAIVKAMLEEIVKLPGYTIASLFFSEDGDSYTALHSAVDSKNVEIVKMICQAAGTGLSELLKITDDNGYEALHYAIDHGVAEVAKVMLEVIAKLSNDDIIQLLFFDAIEKSAIHISINHDNADILNAIIKAAGSNIIDLLNQQDSEDITPLQLAIIENKIQMLTIMLEAAGEKMSDVIYQQDLLHMAVKIGSTEAIEAIINCCPGLERQVLLEARSRPCTPLLTAAQDNNRDAVMSILSTEHIDIKKLIEREQENSHIIFKMLNASELAGIFEIQFSDQVDSSLNAVFIKDAALKKALEILQKHGINDTEKSWQSKVSSTSKKSKQEDLIHKEAEYIVSQIISPAKAHQQSDGQSRI